MPIDQAVVLIDSHERSSRKILGLTSLERILFSAETMGVRKFFIIGKDGEAGEKTVAALRRDRRVVERNLELSFSALADLSDKSKTVSAPTGRFWLMEPGLVFAPAIMKKAAAAVSGDRSIVVLNGVHGKNPANASVAECGCGTDCCRKSGSPANGVSSGLTLAAPGTFSELAAVLSGSDGAILDAKARERVFPGSRTDMIEAGELYCETVASDEAAKRARQYLLGTARKPTDGFFSRNFNRHISLFLTRQLLKINATPSAISVVVLAVGLMSGWFVGRIGYLNAVIGALLFEIASIIDGCDGENARLTYRFSKAGGMFDITADAVTFVFFFVNIPIGLYRTTGRPLWLILLGISFLSMMLFYAQLIRYGKKVAMGSNIISVAKDIERLGRRPGFSGMLDWLAAKLVPVFRRDFFATWALLIILFGGEAVFMGIIALLSPVETVFMFFYSRRKLRESESAA